MSIDGQPATVGECAVRSAALPNAIHKTRRMLRLSPVFQPGDAHSGNGACIGMDGCLPIQPLTRIRR